MTTQRLPKIVISGSPVGQQPQVASLPTARVDPRSGDANDAVVVDATAAIRPLVSESRPIYQKVTNA
jgi:hypothetical protein